MKQNIFWWIQHVDEIGGTEMVSIDLMNHLCEDYNITCIVTSEITKELTYEINPNIKVISLGMPHEVLRVDQYIANYNSQHKYFKSLGLLFRVAYYYTFKRPIYRKKVKRMFIYPSDILVCSSGDSYYYAPRRVNCIFHYHFNSILYNSFGNKMLMAACRKADKEIFLSKTTLDIINRKNDSKKSYIYNPVRFNPELDLTYHNNRILFVGRYAAQKDPFLALAVAKELNDRKFDFVLDMYGSGGDLNRMLEFVKSNHLENVVHINAPTTKIKEEMKNSDLLLITSTYEGLILTKNEANAMSTPVVSSNWGDTVYEIFNEGQDGFVIDSRDPKIYADKIINILSDKEYLKELKKNSYQNSFRYGYSTILEQWKKLFDSFK